MRRAIAGGASGAAGGATPDAAAPMLRLHTHSTAAALAADIKGGQGGVGGEGVSGCCFQSGCLRPLKGRVVCRSSFWANSGVGKRGLLDNED